MAVKRRVSTKEEHITNEILLIFSCAFVAILGIIMIDNMFKNTSTALTTTFVLAVLGAVLLLCCAAGVVIAVRGKKQKNSRQRSIGLNFAVFSAAYAFICLYASYFFIDGIKHLYFLVPAVAVVSLIYFLYPSDFFAQSIITGAGGFLLFYFSNRMAIGYISTAMIIISAGAFALLAAAVVFGLILKKKRGRLSLAGKRFQVFPSNANYAMYFVTCALIAASLALSIVLGPERAYMFMFGVFTYLFVLAVFYTVKMM